MEAFGCKEGPDRCQWVGPGRSPTAAAEHQTPVGRHGRGSALGKETWKVNWNAKMDGFSKNEVIDANTGIREWILWCIVY